MNPLTTARLPRSSSGAVLLSFWLSAASFLQGFGCSSRRLESCNKFTSAPVLFSRNDLCAGAPLN